MVETKSSLVTTKSLLLVSFFFLFSICSSSTETQETSTQQSSDDTSVESSNTDTTTETQETSTQQSSDDTSVETSTTVATPERTISDYFDEMEYSIPQDYFAQEILVSEDVPQYVVDEYIEVQSLLNETVGSYNRYLMIIYTDNANSENIFKRLEEVHWPFELNIVDGNLIGAGCLTGSGNELNPPDVYALCLMDYNFVNNPHESIERGLSEAQRKAILYHGYIHEYFHRYQRAYHRELNMGTPEVGTPMWWIEGLPGLAAPMMTDTGLVFSGVSNDHTLRAFDLDSGEELWKAELPTAANAPPLTYQVRPGGRQYVVVAAGGHWSGGAPPGDHVIAFALPQPESTAE